MNIDLNEFIAIFVEEAQEHLSAMESALLALRVDAVTADELNTIFRAAHSIKGGAATFGLDSVAELAHVLESLLDRLRDRRLALTVEMVDALLKAADVIRLQIAQHEGKGAVDPSEVAALAAWLHRLSGSEAHASEDSSAADARAPAATAVCEPAAPSVAAAPAAAPESGSIRVGVEKVDCIMNLVGELVITQAMLAQAASTGDAAGAEKLQAGLAQLERNTRELQEAAMGIRMMPISAVFNRFPRVVRDLAARLGKQVELRWTGEQTELDKGLIERIVDPLTHLVRNSLDHGIESPPQRVAAGKPAAGTITLRALHEGGNVVIDVSDDGAGLDRARILAKARERGIAIPDPPADAEVWGLIFEPGFSTAAAVTDVSGRGVGMDVVRSNIHALGGRVEIHSEPGAGTRMTVRVPLTLAILDGMSVRCGQETFIVPLTCIVESMRPAREAIKTVSGAGRVLRLRDRYLPILALHTLMEIPDAVQREEDGILVVLEADNRTFALFVDALVGQHQVVIKSLETHYRRVPGISGATIMGDGRVALILDAADIAQRTLAHRAGPGAAHRLLELQ